MLSDIEIANSCEMRPIGEIAKAAGIEEKYVEQYGKYKAKIDLSVFDSIKKPNGKLVLVTAISPTPAGEGKTTTTIGLADGIKRLGKNVSVALREPSLGPVFGIKGGAAGGGYAQVVPMEDINLHFTGDFHAIGAANNLLAAMLDNHIHQGNDLGIDTRKITWKRCVDMNDRQLRNIVDGLGGKVNGVPREDGFDITVASEIMAVLCLSSSISELKERLSKIIVGYTFDDRPVTAGQLNAQGAMAALLKDALKPNLVQTLEGTPAFVHGGPFANIAHGCNSVTATKLSLALSVISLCEQQKGNFSFAYEDDLSIAEKIEAVAKKIYGGDGVVFTDGAKKQIDNLEKLGFSNCPVCIAKTQYSFSDDASKLGAPEGFSITVRNVKVSAGAGFIVVLTGNIMTMPGLPKRPAAERIDIDDSGKISGLF